ncbi:MAG: Xaa-Pro aminopeptidase, partial [Otoolea sp.]
GIGVTGGEVWSRVKEVIGSYEEFGIALNPGHLIHTEEWTNSPFVENGTAVLKSGMLIQCDFTARPASCMGLGVHTEDGLILADRETREEIRRQAPDSYERMMNRQTFMREVLGINLRDEVLPTSDICGMLHPFFADLDCLVVRDR